MFRGMMFVKSLNCINPSDVVPFVKLYHCFCWTVGTCFVHNSSIFQLFGAALSHQYTQSASHQYRQSPSVYLNTFKVCFPLKWPSSAQLVCGSAIQTACLVDGGISRFIPCVPCHCSSSRVRVKLGIERLLCSSFLLLNEAHRVDHYSFRTLL